MRGARIGREQRKEWDDGWVGGREGSKVSPRALMRLCSTAAISSGLDHSSVLTILQRPG